MSSAPPDGPFGGEITQINAAAALGIAPEPPPAARSVPPDKPDRPSRAPRSSLPPEKRVDFGELRLADKDELKARYPVELLPDAVGQLANRVPLVVTLSKLLPVLLGVMLLFIILAALLVNPLFDLAAISSGRQVLPPPSIQTVNRPPLPAAPPKRTAQEQAKWARGMGANLALETSPSKAEVEIDGQVVGGTPLELLPLDTDSDHKLALLLPGYHPWRAMISRDGERYRIEVDPQSTYEHDGTLDAGSDGWARLTVELTPK